MFARLTCTPSMEVDLVDSLRTVVTFFASLGITRARGVG